MISDFVANASPVEEEQRPRSVSPTAAVPKEPGGAHRLRRIIYSGGGDRGEQVERSEDVERPHRWLGQATATQDEWNRGKGRDGSYSDRQMRPDTKTPAAIPEKSRRASGTSFPDVALNEEAKWVREFVAGEDAKPTAADITAPRHRRSPYWRKGSEL